MTKKELKEWVDVIIIFLAHPDHRELEFDYYELADFSEIPQHQHVHVFNELWNTYPKLIDAKPSLKPKIKISKAGLEYAEKFDDQIYFTTGQSVFDQPIDMTMPETCKFIFEKHISNGGTLAWFRETFRPNPPRNLYPAKDLLLHSGLIINTRKYYTVIAPPYIEATSYEDAIRIMKEREEKSKANTTHVSVGGDMIQSPILQDSFLDTNPTLYPNQNISTDAPKTNQTDGSLMKFWKLISDNKLISTILAALILAAIYYFFGIKTK